MKIEQKIALLKKYSESTDTLWMWFMFRNLHNDLKPSCTLIAKEMVEFLGDGKIYWNEKDTHAYVVHPIQDLKDIALNCDGNPKTVAEIVDTSIDVTKQYLA